MDLEPVSGETLPKRTFVESFRVICWQFLLYQESLRDIPPFFDECPKTCYIYGKDKKEKDYCDNCDVKIARDTFEESAKAELDDRTDKKWKRYKFNDLLNWVYDAFELKRSKVNMSVTAEIMVGILISEQNKQDRIRDYNRKLKEKD